MAADAGELALLVGLGNPGREYRGNRHNIGFMVLDEVARRAGIEVRTRRFQGHVGQGPLAGRKVVLLKPETYMNLSGESVGAAARFYRIAPEDVVVVHDELDLPFGKLQIKDGGGHGGHNGVRSIAQHLGANAFRRVRIGIGRPPDSRIPAADYVLSDFGEDEERVLGEVLATAADAVEVILKEGVKAAMNRFNGKASQRKERALPE
jgi:PTH1 family peptidyl-tRNA hydrolase